MDKIKKVVILFLIASSATFSDDSVKLSSIAPQENNELVKSGIYENKSQDSISADALQNRIGRRTEKSWMIKYRNCFLLSLAYLVLMLGMMMLFLYKLILYPITYMQKKFKMLSKNLSNPF